jgi:hypothetical protein
VIRSDKKLKELGLTLGRKNPLQITQAVKSLRDDEPFEGVVELLVGAYDSSEDKSVLKTIGEFFNDQKDPAVRPEIIAEIRKPWKESTISMLVSSCWLSGMDYADYLGDMVNIFIKCEYATAIECMTVIEGSVAQISSERKREMSETIREASGAWVNEKNSLTMELLSIIGR